MSFQGKNTFWASADRRTKIHFDIALRTLGFFVDDVQIFTLKSDSIGLYGSTVTAKATAPAAVASTAPTNSGAWGATTSTQFAALVTAVNTLINNLTGIGAQA